MKTVVRPRTTQGSVPHTLPFDQETEEAVLGAAMVSASACDRVVRDLTSNDFFVPSNRIVHGAISELSGSGGPVDPISTRLHLERTGRIAEVQGGPTYIAVLSTLCPDPGNVSYYIRTLRDLTHRRRVAETSTHLTAAASTGSDMSAAAAAVMEAVADPTDRTDPESSPRLMDGARFVLDGSATPRAIWGEGSRVLTSEGEYTVLVGPDGTGKTTIGGQYALARVGIFPVVLGLPVRPVERRGLLVAADRPGQIGRRLRQMVTEDERADLHDRLVVHRGVLPFDIGDRGRLLSWTNDLGIDALIIDSLGSIVARLASDEVGSAVAIELRRVADAGVDVFLLFHGRKASPENKKPTALADVYGSRWLTAGAGSVIGLWGAPGDPVIEFRHLKQPAEEVGPFLIAIDHETGFVSVVAASDLLGALRSTPGGLAPRAAARVLYGADGRAEVERARRALEKLAERGLAYRAADRTPTIYYATTSREAP